MQIRQQNDARQKQDKQKQLLPDKRLMEHNKIRDTKQEAYANYHSDKIEGEYKKGSEQHGISLLYSECYEPGCKTDECHIEQDTPEVIQIIKTRIISKIASTIAFSKTCREVGTDKETDSAGEQAHKRTKSCSEKERESHRRCCYSAAGQVAGGSGSV